MASSFSAASRCPLACTRCGCEWRPPRLRRCRCEFAVCAPRTVHDARRVQIRLGSATGSLLASVTVPATGRDHSTLVTLTVPLAAADFGSGVHNLLVVFGQDNGCNLAWLELVGGDSMSPAVSLRADAAAEAQGCRVTGGCARAARASVRHTRPSLTPSCALGAQHGGIHAEGRVLVVPRCAAARHRHLCLAAGRYLAAKQRG